MHKLIGTKEFYKNTLRIVIPILLQNLITAFVAMLDNIMVGRLGTDPMSGVAIINQLFFVYLLLIVGAIAGPGIFCAQFYGKHDTEGVHSCFRYKLYSVLLSFILAAGVFTIFGEKLISFYLNDSGGAGNPAATMGYAKGYLNIIIVGLLPFALSQAYASTLRECGRIKLPMYAGIVAVLVNTVLNYLLIFGKFGFPMLGANGAAIATVISRYVEMAIILIATHTDKEQYPFAVGFYKSLKIKVSAAKMIFVTGVPLLCNEFLWGVGTAILNQCYAYRGLVAVAAINISSTIYNLFNIIYLAMGNAVAIIIGHLLGAGKSEEAKQSAAQLLALAAAISAGIGMIMALLSGIFPMIYNTEPIVRTLAKNFILTSSVMLVFHAFYHNGYYTLRCGGKSITMLLIDSGFLFALEIPLAFILSRFTALPAAPLYLAVQSLTVVRCILIFILLKKSKWAQNIVKDM